MLTFQREPCQNWHCLVKCHIHGKLCSRCAGMPFSLKAWVCFCSALEFTASRMSQQEFVASACSSRRGAFPQPGAASPGHSPKCSCVLGREQRSPWVLPAGMGFGAATRLVFLSCCPMHSADTYWILRALQGPAAPLCLCALVRGCSYKPLKFQELEPCFFWEKQGGPRGRALICVILSWI